VDRIPPEALLAEYPESTRAVADALRALVARAQPDVLEAVRPGWCLLGYDVPNGRRTAYFAWIMPEVPHVHLGFVHGVFLHDPDRTLHGNARLARWVTFRSVDEIQPAPLETLVREGARVARLTRAERVLRMLDPDMGPGSPS
jgi:hypothetical protein